MDLVNRKPAVLMKNLSKKFDGQTVIDNISFSQSLNETVAILGKNGSGKTTLIKLLIGLYQPTSGNIKLFGQNPTKHPAVKEKISYLSGDYNLYPNLTVRETIELAASLYNTDIDPDKALNIIRKEGIDLDKEIKLLSRGQLQLVKLAAALVNDPDLIILDEPTSGLDILVRQRLLARLCWYKDEENINLLFTSHNFSEISQLADRIILLDQGKKLADLKMEELPNFNKEIIFVPQKDLKKRDLGLDKIHGINQITLEDKKFIINYSKDEANILYRLSEIPYLSLKIKEPDLADIFHELIEGGRQDESE
ncbi:ABC transporter ATP-binding protein [Halanaerobiaceae bacterium Z-7014]|uniref:ABC transporter ATP-binding protein n=1 Tax=Halonatronomonas betaini TaxID=2778430 RepID=A0A931ARW5_9FIRM|nr:ABC transporter ATP-binding protein [Halonatronomonas betaini]MBF8437842.1 ABC transporter ATP-binding protein [Halonatronomonas betaini]